MTDSPTRHLVAPELLGALEYFPALDFSQGLAVFRSGFDDRPVAPLPPELEAVTLRERFIPGAAGTPDVRVLHYTPPGKPTGQRAAVLEIHGGGFVLGSADMGDVPNRATALQLDCVVVSVDYRLAPDTPWPGPLQDNYAALSWLHDNADELGIDPSRIAVSGGSAGGGHAAALAIHARDLRRKTGAGPSLCFQLIDFPMLDDRTCIDPDPHAFVGEFVWTPELNRFGWASLLGTEPGGPDVPEAAVPARTRDLSDLPPAFISIGALDLFLEESLEYARRLTRVGVPVELHVTPGGFHGFGMAVDAPQSQQVNQLRMQALGRALATG